MDSNAEPICPNCGKPVTGSTTACECGFSHYPRPPEPLPFKVTIVSEEQKRASAAKAGMFLGFLSLLGPLGIFYTLITLIMAFMLCARGFRSTERKKAQIGLICCFISVVIWIITIMVFRANPKLDKFDMVF